ncbi:flagellar FliL protein [Sanguibacter gelidistatuariae]|uniref:Flagellar protein FliL n=1 Tax=Sanguibacter gelidistatuariae TaxID=1814289 RepID=A0A1G6PYI3_9MICO|nr:flagellar basal body-associated FliL family protein [Sanguibacter gelidistatuariae]SDC85021.1 flagellar FliL protein [Sanguibacter gelidistatuariae]
MPIEQRVMNAPRKPIGARPGAAPVAGAAETEEPKARKSKKRLVVIAAVLVAAGAAAYFFVLAPKSGETAEPAPEPGAVLVVEAMSINLAEGHYLRLGLGLQLTTDALEVDSAKARDEAIALFSGRTIAEISDPATREALKTELAAALTELYDGEVMGVYLTDYVTQ